MTDQQKPKIENLEQDAQELTPEEAEEVQGGMMVIAVSHEIISPRDPASGLPTGR